MYGKVRTLYSDWWICLALLQKYMSTWYHSSDNNVFDQLPVINIVCLKEEQELDIELSSLILMV